MPKKINIKPLSVKETYVPCSTSELRLFSAAKKSQLSDFEIISQQRAVQAINTGLGIRKPGYNIFVTGFQGTGKSTVIQGFLEKMSKKLPTPSDWVYVYNFETPEIPKIIQIPAGEGRVFRKKMQQILRTLKIEIPRALQSEDYENNLNKYANQSNERRGRLFTELEKMAAKFGFAIKTNPVGIETVPIGADGEPITEQDYASLSEKERRSLERKRAQIEPQVLDFARKVRILEQETREYVDVLRADIGRSLGKQYIDPIIEEYSAADCAEIVTFLQSIKEHVVDNVLDFVEMEEDDEDSHEGTGYEPVDPATQKEKFRSYEVNLFVDRAHQKGAPIIIETNPTYYNLFGKVEKSVEHGVYHTDFTLIKAGSLHRANGGYLVINANDIFRNPGIWEMLKRVMRARLGFIEDFGEQVALLPTSGLKPEPMPLDVKVILIGNDEIYHFLHEEDEDFGKIFKIKADFDYKMQRTPENLASYVRFIRRRIEVENLKPFDQTAFAAIIELSSRLVEDKNLLSSQFGDLKDLIIEADFIAEEHQSKKVLREHVESAWDRKTFRLNLFEQHVMEAVQGRDVILQVDGSCVGQINGLTVYDLGDYSFGKIGRITCTSSISDDGINNIERSARLSGKTHDKGMFIIAGFLNAILAKERDLGIAASICFEQSYGMIDGDSASAAELIAVLSSLAEIPIHQNYAITGSLSQFGEIQAIGGINEKIEGFYKTVCILGHEKKYNVIVPEANVQNLVLHREVREAIASKFLNIYPVRYIWEAFELITGVPLGVESVHEKTFSKNSALQKIHEKLERLQKIQDADSSIDHRVKRTVHKEISKHT